MLLNILRKRKDLDKLGWLFMVLGFLLFPISAIDTAIVIHLPLSKLLHLFESIFPITLFGGMLGAVIYGITSASSSNEEREQYTLRTLIYDVLVCYLLSIGMGIVFALLPVF